MNCPRCQLIATPGAAYCGNCGTPLTTPLATNLPNYPRIVSQPVMEALALERSGLLLGDEQNDKAVMALVLGVLGLAAWLIPAVGVVISALAIIFGTMAIKSRRRPLAISGIVLGVLVLAVSLYMLTHNAQRILSARTSPSTPYSSQTASGDVQEVVTPCYRTKIPASMQVSQTTGSCTFLGVDRTRGEQMQVKVLQVPSLTLANLSNAAKLDAANVVGSIPGGSIQAEGADTFAKAQSYGFLIAATDGSAGAISYVYGQTPQGNLLIVLHTVPSGGQSDLKLMEANWSWQ